MSDSILSNRLAGARRERGWSQQALADASGVSRAEVSAIETGRLTPSVATSLSLARALRSEVEALFALGTPVGEPVWAWTPRRARGLFWEAVVGGRRLLFPVEPTAMGSVPHDGLFGPGGLERSSWAAPDRTLVVAGCDPAVGLLASELARSEGLRLLPLTRGSGDALELLRQGLVHAAGLHWSEPGRGRGGDANASMVARELGSGFRLIHVARWEEGIALEPAIRARSAAAVARAKLRWIAREEGSGARAVLDRLLGKHKRRFRHVARDHRAVALAIRSGYAQAGIAVRLAAEEAGVDFLPLQQEDYELCCHDEPGSAEPLASLRRALKRSGLRRLTSDLPGHDATRMGEERAVA